MVSVSVALLVRLEAKPGKEAEVEAFLKGGLAIVIGEPATTAWFAIRMGPRPSGSSTRSPTTKAVRLTSQAESPQLSWPRLESSCPSPRRSTKSTSSRRSFQARSVSEVVGLESRHTFSPRCS